jgi:hypothetical protein
MKGAMMQPGRDAEARTAPLLVQLVTSSWFTKLPDTVARIGISKGSPRGQSGFRRYAPLVPSFPLHVPLDAYLRLYGEQLARLDPQRVVADIAALAGDKPMAALLCFERSDSPPSDWCHRGLVSQWFAETIRLDMPEWGCEHGGTGCRHPKLPPV